MSIIDKMLADSRIGARLYLKHAHKPWITNEELKYNIECYKRYIDGKD